MKQLLVFIRKEFYHVFRDRRTLLIMFGIPVAQILLFGFALTSEVKNAKIIISDNAKDTNSQQIIHKIKAYSYFLAEEATVNYTDIEKVFRKGELKCAVIFPPHFGNDLLRSGNAQIQIIGDGSVPNTANGLIMSLTGMIGD